MEEEDYKWPDCRIVSIIRVANEEKEASREIIGGKTEQNEAKNKSFQKILAKMKKRLLCLNNNMLTRLSERKDLVHQ